ncbi:MAG: hypothetical protein H6739_12275 [Alphaproteobacteria bacterium]|nr:hypothetical protein [Alphaproteobacteria bacterium]
MASRYAQVRRQWRDIDTRADLEAIWRGERFDDAAAVDHALRVYEVAIRVDGWASIIERARPLLAEGAILNAQLVELAMRSLEQQDEAFFAEISEHLLASSPPNWFRFWFTLFSTRHSHRGERLFRAQLAQLDDYRVVKYRRRVREVFRKLRFRCETPREKAIGAIAFAMYKDYDPAAYPSEPFEALVACHRVASSRPKTSSGRAVSKARHAELFAVEAAKLGIWSIAEGIRTSVGLPRTLAYLSAMAPKMTDNELRRALRAFDGMLGTATHKKASEDVLKLALYIGLRLRAMDIPLDEWCKILPALSSPVLVEVLETLIAQAIEATRPQGRGWNPILVVPETLDGRRFRAALLGAYQSWLGDAMAQVHLIGGTHQTLSHPTALQPQGYGAQPTTLSWRAEPPEPHRALFLLIRQTFPTAANRRQSAAAGPDSYLHALRHHLHRRATLDGAVSDHDVPVLVFAEEPAPETRHALAAHLELFPGAALVLLQRAWERPLALDHVLHLNAEATSAGLIQALGAVSDALPEWKRALEARRPRVDRALRHLLLGPPPPTCHVVHPV